MGADPAGAGAARRRLRLAAIASRDRSSRSLATRPAPVELLTMSVVLITGAAGLIGSEAALVLRRQGLRRRRHRQRHAALLLRRRGSTAWQPRDAGARRCAATATSTPTSATRRAIDALFAALRQRHRARHPHRRAAVARLGGARAASPTSRVNANGTLILLEATRRHCPDAVVHLHLHQQGLRRHARTACRWSSWRRAGRSTPAIRYAGTASTRRCRIDQTHARLFGASKVAADVLVQEYGRYFGMKTACFRGGCLTGPGHSGAELHGFLAYLVKCARHRPAVHGLRLQGQAGPRQHPLARPGQRVLALLRRRRAAARSTTSAAAGFATARCSRRSPSASG